MVCRKEVHVSQVFDFLGVIFLKNSETFAGSMEIPAKIEKSINLKTVEDKQITSMEHAYKLGSLFQNSWSNGVR